MKIRGFLEWLGLARHDLNLESMLGEISLKKSLKFEYSLYDISYYEIPSIVIGDLNAGLCISKSFER